MENGSRWGKKREKKERTIKPGTVHISTCDGCLGEVDANPKRGTSLVSFSGCKRM